MEDGGDVRVEVARGFEGFYGVGLDVVRAGGRVSRPGRGVGEELLVGPVVAREGDLRSGLLGVTRGLRGCGTGGWDWVSAHIDLPT